MGFGMLIWIRAAVDMVKYKKCWIFSVMHLVSGATFGLSLGEEAAYVAYEADADDIKEPLESFVSGRPSLNHLICGKNSCMRAL